MAAAHEDAVTHYAADTSGWEDWQKGYRFGVLLVLPPDPPRSQVDALRARHDRRSHAFCGAHVSLRVPLPRPVTPAHWAELEAMASGVAPFTARYGPLRHYLPHPGVCLRIEPQAELDHLRAALKSASCFAGATPRTHPFSAHMTLAEFVSADETQRLMRELAGAAPRGSSLCDAVSYVVPDAGFRFTQRGRLQLGL